MQKTKKISIIIITHDLGVVANIAKHVAVMYGGMVVESGTVMDIFYRSKHPYTWGLLDSVSRENKKKGKALVSIEGTPPDLVKPPKGCPFAGRCRYATEQCRNEKPELKEFPGGHQVACHRAEELHSAGGML